jgi:uncharacterized protein
MSVKRRKPRCERGSAIGPPRQDGACLAGVDGPLLRPSLAAGLVNTALLVGFAAWQSRAVISVVTQRIDPIEELHFVLHMALMAMLACVASIGCIVIAQAVDRTRWGVWAASFIQSFLWVVVVVDLKVFQLLGVHLDDYAVVESIRSGGFVAEINLGAATYLSLAAFAATVWVANLGLLNLSRKRSRRSEGNGARSVVVPTAAVLAVMTALAWSWCTIRAVEAHPAFLEVLPFFRSICDPFLPQVNVTLTYPDPSLPANPVLRTRKSVILVVFESFRADVLTEELTPNLYAFSKREGCIVPKYNFAGSHETASSMFSLLYGLDGFYMDLVAKQGLASWPLSTLKRNGYQLLGGSAAHLRGWSQSDLWISQFDEFHEFADHGDHNDDEDLARWAEEQISRRDPERPFLLLLFFHATHHNYYYPPEFEVDRPVLPVDYDHFMGDHKLARFRTEVFNRYKNSVRYTDRLFARIAAAADRAPGKDRCVFVVTADHGEEFWDHGLLGHSAARLNNARTRVPLLLFVPASTAQPVALSGHADVLPTLLDVLGLHPRVDPALYSSGRSLLVPDPADQALVVVSAAHRPFGRRELLAVNAGREYLLRETFTAGRFSLRKVTKLDEQNLPGAAARRLDGGVMSRFESAFSRFLTITPPGSREHGH